MKRAKEQNSKEQWIDEESLISVTYQAIAHIVPGQVSKDDLAYMHIESYSTR